DRCECAVRWRAARWRCGAAAAGCCYRIRRSGRTDRESGALPRPARAAARLGRPRRRRVQRGQDAPAREAALVVLWYIVALLFSGLIVGALARVILPGPDPMSVPGTIVLGLAGSFLGGVIAWLFIGHAAGIVFSVLGATALLY